MSASCAGEKRSIQGPILLEHEVKTCTDCTSPSTKSSSICKVELVVMLLGKLSLFDYCVSISVPGWFSLGTGSLKGGDPLRHFDVSVTPESSALSSPLFPILTNSPTIAVSIGFSVATPNTTHHPLCSRRQPHQY